MFSLPNVVLTVYLGFYGLDYILVFTWIMAAVSQMWSMWKSNKTQLIVIPLMVVQKEVIKEMFSLFVQVWCDTIMLNVEEIYG